MESKYIANGQQFITIKDRANGRTPYTRARRWIVWNETTQTVMGEYSTRKAAIDALNAM